MNQNNAEIEELIRRARQGNREALGEILDGQRPNLRAVAKKYITGKLAARLDASDVIQQTCLSVYENFKKFDGNHEAEFIAWLQRIHEQNIQNAIRDHTRAQKRAVGRECSLDAGPQFVPQAKQSTPSQRAIRGEEGVRLAEMLGRLSEDQRDVVRLRHLEEFSLAQIAEQMNRSEAAIIGLLKRGMQNLRKYMSQDE